MRQSQRAGEHARAAAGDETDRDLWPDAVQHFVEAAVAGEDEDSIRVGTRSDLRPVPRTLGPDDVDITQLRGNLRDARRRHRGRLWIDDQEWPRHRPRTMPRIDHVAVETRDPDEAAAFYERIFGASVVKAEGHPVMAYLGNTGFAFHERDGPGEHTGVRMSAEEQAELKRRLDEAGIEWAERDHEIAVGVFFEDPDGRLLEAIVYRGT
jgi:catechol 2,3-dioxygenase-like lactoylglutathione lyase family enzyme